MAVVAVVTFLITLGVGTYNISMSESLAVFFQHVFGQEVTHVFTGTDYIWDVRTPRAIAAVLAGTGLSIGGVVMQNLLKNPLAEPYTMGVSSGAMFGVTLSIGLEISIFPFLTGTAATMANALLFSLIPVAIIMLISMFKKVTPVMMILTGIAVMYLFSSINSIIMVTSDADTMQNIYMWNIGTLTRVGWEDVPLLATSTVLLSAIIYAMSRHLDVMYVGDKSAQSLGLKVNAFRITLLVLASFLTAVLVCCMGTIGFVGLVAPHVARIFVGSTNRYLIPASAAFGTAFLLIADTLAKLIGTGTLPVGVISGIVGGPLFIYILVRQRKNAWM